MAIRRNMIKDKINIKKGKKIEGQNCWNYVTHCLPIYKYGRQSISRPMRIVAPIDSRVDQEYPKTGFFSKTKKIIQYAKIKNI